MAKWTFHAAFGIEIESQSEPTEQERYDLAEAIARTVSEHKGNYYELRSLTELKFSGSVT